MRVLLFGKAREMAEATEKVLVVPSKINGGALRKLIFEKVRLRQKRSDCILCSNSKPGLIIKPLACLTEES